jgi:hypothetical protein
MSIASCVGRLPRSPIPGANLVMFVDGEAIAFEADGLA